MKQSSTNFEFGKGSGARSFRGSHRGHRARGHRGSYGGGNPRPFCQICERPGHTAANYFHRFERSFQSPSDHGYFGNPNHNYISPQAHYVEAGPQTIVDPMWYMDSGVSHHMIAHVEHLQNFTLGKTHLFTCTGEKVCVAGIGSSSLSLPNSKLHLNKVLVVPSATKNLISVKS